MKKALCAVAVMFVMALPSLAAECDSVFIQFGRNEGKAAFDRIIREQGSDIQCMVNHQLQNPTTRISVNSNADGVRYANDHIKKNVVMTVERNVTGADLLEYFHADMSRVATVATNIESDTGSVYRYVILRLVTEPPPEPKAPVLAPVAQAPPVVVIDSTKHYVWRPPLFGGVTVSLSTAPQAHGVLCVGAQINLRPKLIADAKIGHSIITNDRRLNDGSSVEAYGMLYHASLTYVLAQQLERRVAVTVGDAVDPLQHDTALVTNVDEDEVAIHWRVGALFGVTQVENDTKSTFDYLLKRRAAEIGLLLEHGSIAVRGFVGYGWDEYYDRLDVDYKATGRLELVVTL